jgi:hypothetical protein
MYRAASSLTSKVGGSDPHHAPKPTKTSKVTMMIMEKNLEDI